jgi:hypothetical protein
MRLISTVCGAQTDRARFHPIKELHHINLIVVSPLHFQIVETAPHDEEPGRFVQGFI